MYLILYNPVSRNGANTSVVEKLIKKMRKKHAEVKLKSLLEINDKIEFLKSLEPNTKIIIVGGDGTLNRLANEIRYCDNLPDIYLYKAGTGNDFRRSIKERGRIIKITKYLTNLPEVKFNGDSQVFLNGIGLGFDAKVCYIVEEPKITKTKLNFFQSVFRAFKGYERIDFDVEVDGVSKTYKKVWMATVMNSKYYGGGMRIAPKASRLNDDFYTIIVHNISKLKLMILFPLIYLGLHKYIRGVKIIKGKNVKIRSVEPLYMQIDGEVYNDIVDIEVLNNK